MRVLAVVASFALGAMGMRTSGESFLQMGLKTRRVATEYDDDDDLTYGAYGTDDAAMDESDHLGVHEFIEASDDQIDEEDQDDPDIAKAAADDEATNFGEDGADGEESEYGPDDQMEADDSAFL